MLKAPREIGRGSEAKGLSDPGNGPPRFGQKLARLKDTAILQNFDRRPSTGTAAAPCQMRWCHAKRCCKLANACSLAKLLFQKGSVASNQTARGIRLWLFWCSTDRLAFQPNTQKTKVMARCPVMRGYVAAIHP